VLSVLVSSIYEKQLDKINALRVATLERRTVEDDIPDPGISVHFTKTIPVPQEVCLEEGQDDESLLLWYDLDSKCLE
jgi:hypothetical protein